MWQGKARLAALLWLAFAGAVWNVVFDRVLVVAGRVYVHDAALAARRQQPFLKIDDYMRPALHDGLWLASVAGGSVALVGLVAVRMAVRRDRRRTIRDERSAAPRRN